MSATESTTEGRCDVLVIGGGPAGSTISALLAERGRDVVLIEKERHPRFHIGESLLPLNMPLFERLGVAREIERIGMPKYGAELVSQWHAKPLHVDFANAWGRDFPVAYQVRRSEFDRILFRNAARKGARTIEGCRVTGVDFHPDGAVVTVRQEDGLEKRWQTRFVADASGRDTFLANRLDIKQRNNQHNSAALFGHFSGARRLPGKREGNISLFWFEHGWFWFIPLPDGVTSIGAVCSPCYMNSRKTDPRQFLLETIALSPALAKRLRNADLISAVTATGNYSYVASRPSGRNYLLLGDAFAFVDPIFSTGVMLAMQSAFVGGDTIETCLDRPRAARGALKTFDASARHGLRTFSWFIYRAMTPALRALLMNPTQRFRMQPAVLSVLAGDVFRGTPVGLRLLVFKILYYLISVFRFRASLMAWIHRGRAIRETGVRVIAGLIPAIAVMLGLAIASAHAGSLPLWEVGAGVSVIDFPDYRGSEERQTWVLPFPYFIYRGEFLKADERKVRGLFFKTDRVELDASINGTVPVKSGKNAARQGMPDLDATLEIGPSLNFSLLRSADRQTSLELRLPVRAVLASDLSHVDLAGWVFQPSLNLDTRDVLGYTGWKFGLLGGPVYSNGRYNRYFYAVDPAFATASRPAYSPGGGYGGAQFIAALSKRYRDFWIGGFAKWDALNQAVFADSPLVTAKQTFSMGVAVAWMLGESKTRVEAEP